MTNLICRQLWIGNAYEDSLSMQRDLTVNFVKHISIDISNFICTSN
jgi:hypothetical protein